MSTTRNIPEGFDGYEVNLIDADTFGEKHWGLVGTPGLILIRDLPEDTPVNGGTLFIDRVPDGFEGTDAYVYLPRNPDEALWEKFLADLRGLGLGRMDIGTVVGIIYADMDPIAITRGDIND